MILSQKHIATARLASLFRELSDEDIEDVFSSSQMRQVNDGEYFFMEEDSAEMAYVLLEGKVKLSQVTTTGQQIILGYLVPGRAYGIIAILKKITYPVSAQAVGQCKALAWDHETLNRMMEQHPRMALNAMRIMAGQIRELQNQVQELATQRVEQRIARAVLRLASHAGRQVEEGVLIDLPLSRQDLAEMTGTTLYTVSRVLKDWEHQGLVQSKRQQVIIQFPQHLINIAEDAPPGKVVGLAGRENDLCDLPENVQE